MALRVDQDQRGMRRTRSEEGEVAGQGKASGIRRAPIGDLPRVNREHNAPLSLRRLSRGQDVAQPRQAVEDSGKRSRRTCEYESRKGVEYTRGGVAGAAVLTMTGTPKR